MTDSPKRTIENSSKNNIHLE